MDPRPMQQLLADGLKLQFSGQLAEAEQVYKEMLSRDPNSPEATHFMGVLAHQFGRMDLAEDLIRRSILLNPRVAGFHNNLGEILRTAGKFDEAVRSYKRAIQLEPNFVEAYSNIGVILAKQRMYEEAKLWLLQALRLRPDFVPALHLLGGLLMEMGQFEDAKVPLKRVIELQPDHAEARYLYAAASGGADAPAAPPTPYIAGVFDGYADHFDEHLTKDLAYRVPQLLRAAVDRARPEGSFDILDLGCGTGLTGVAFRDRAKTLAGVDVSAGMIEQAKRRNLYQQLEVNELLPALDDRRGQLDLVLAGDVFGYVGDLAPVFAATRAALRSGGLFAFSVEKLEGEGFLLRPTRRYAHSRHYVESLAAANGFRIFSIDEAALRKEGITEVAGLIFVLEV